jgi:hypothetical protein
MKTFVLVNSLSRQITQITRSKPFQQHSLPLNVSLPPYSAHPSWVLGTWRHFTSNHTNKRSFFSRSPAMSQHSSEQQQQNTQFQGTTVPELEAWLQQHGINTSLYGVGASKPLELLFEEVAVGESILSTSSSTGVQRTVSVVNVRILNPSDKALYEATQILPTGIERPRNLPLSEKMLPSENWREAVIRGIDEELGSILVPNPDVSIDDTTYMKTEEVKESQSYPGLQTNVR